MMGRDISEFIRLVGSLSLDQEGKQRVVDFLKNNAAGRKDSPAKIIAVASAVACLAVGTFLVARGGKQDINIM